MRHRRAISPFALLCAPRFARASRAACVFVTAVLACTNPVSHPPALADCVATLDASCSTPNIGAGTGSGVGGSDSGSTQGDDTGTGGTCGIAAFHVEPGDATCQPCIVGPDCCLLVMACGTVCIELLDCTQGCPQGDTLCVGNCENTFAAGFPAYRDLAACLATSCSALCAALPQ